MRWLDEKCGDCSLYEFEIPGGPNDVGLAENELRRLWANEGSPGFITALPGNLGS
jgi:hypothetical protein